MSRIFEGNRLSSLIAEKRRRLIEEIKSLDGNRNIDTEKHKERLYQKYSLGPLKIGEPNPSEPNRTKERRKNMFQETYEVEVFEMKVDLPFEGDKELFNCSPSSKTLVYPDIDYIGDNSIKFTIKLEDLNEGEYKNKINKVVSDIKKNVPNVNSEIEGWDNGLRNLIDNEFKNLEKFVSKKNDFYEKIGLKVNDQADKFITPSPITRKKIPQPKLDKSKSVAKISPRLKDDLYKDIITTLFNVGKAIEKKPALYKGKDEEDLRDIFQLFLETRYESTTATAETFNKAGRTDILLKYAEDGSNLFVGECKIWKGQKKFLEAISQISGYLTWRDSKAAILLFVDNVDFKSTIQSVQEVIADHPLHKRTVNVDGESLSYEIGLEESEDVIISLEVLFFHFPGR
jgi:hypothetical protein